jgi:radical SAM superfamily enzyme YgiQ (UPF0313 family)
MMKNIYFNEYNLLMGSGGIVYLPFVSGILSSYLKTSRKIVEKYRVMPFIFVPNTVENILREYNNPNVACFSISMWNEQLSLSVAKEIKKVYPKCLIIFGGAQCPHEPRDYMLENDFIDICVRAEGEEAILQILERTLDNTCNYDGIPNIAYRGIENKIYINKEVPNYDRSLDKYPSPYLSGEFEYLLCNENHGYQAIVETNRGCPFLCTFCYWGKGGNNTKYRFRSLDTVFAELEYLSSKKVEYIFNADSNFGMHQRDYDIALKLVELKKISGYPEKFRTCWGKNTSERIFKIASILQLHGLDKGVTLARQSNSEIVLKNIKRDNIKLEAYEYLEKNFNKLQVPIYAELILGLPGETINSWKDGIDNMLEAGLNNQLFIYQAEVYPNTELGSKEYQDKFKLKTTKIKLNEIHCSPRSLDWTPEYQHIVTESYSFSLNDWGNMTKYSLVTMLLHSMKAGIFIMAYMNYTHKIKYSKIIETIMTCEENYIQELIGYFEEYVSNLLNGHGRGILDCEYSDVYLEAEEVVFLKITQNKDKFFSELKKTLSKLISPKFHEELSEVIKFQEILYPSFSEKSNKSEYQFSRNIPEFCYSLFLDQKKQIKKQETKVTVYRDNFDSQHDFTKRQLIWARKSGTILYKTDIGVRMREEVRISFDIDNFSSEKDFKISLFDEGREKFEKFNSLKSISLVKAT